MNINKVNMLYILYNKLQTDVLNSQWQFKTLKKTKKNKKKHTDELKLTRVGP